MNQKTVALASFSRTACCSAADPRDASWRADFETHLIETIISLPPKLFDGTVFRLPSLFSTRTSLRKRKIRCSLLTLREDFLEGKNQNTLRPRILQNRESIRCVYRMPKNMRAILILSEIAENDYALNIKQYIDSQKKEELIDVKKVRNRNKSA